MGLSKEEKTSLLGLARAAIHARLHGDGEVEHALARTRLSARLETPTACFVTLSEAGPEPRGRLRGCIGSMEPREPLYRAVMNTATRSAFGDPRFPAVRADELPRLRIEISVLGPVQPVDGPDQILIGRHGVELEKEGRRAVFLPQVPVEHAWDVDELLEQLAIKAGLPRNGWRGARLATFRAEVFGE